MYKAGIIIIIRSTQRILSCVISCSVRVAAGGRCDAGAEQH